MVHVIVTVLSPVGRLLVRNLFALQLLTMLAGLIWYGRLLG